MNWTELKTLEPTKEDADYNGNILILTGESYQLIPLTQIHTAPPDSLWLRNHKDTQAQKLRHEYYELINLNQEDEDIYEYHHPTQCNKCEQQNIDEAIQWLNETNHRHPQ